MNAGLGSEQMNSLIDGFFAKRILETIRVGGNLDQERQDLFMRILKYFDSIQKGKNQINTGSLMENPVKSISAYGRAIEIVSHLHTSNQLDEETFNHILDDVRVEVQNVLNNKIITNLTNTYKFFKQAKKLAVEDTARSSLNTQESINWQIPMQF
jgi:hypothetical protein